MGRINPLACSALLLLLLSGCSGADGPLPADTPLAFSSLPDEQVEGTETTVFSGPGLVCGLSFAIVLNSEETLEQFDRRMDFLTYRLSGVEKAAVIYAGNAPQEADKVIDAGGALPTKIALHLGLGGYTRKLGDRIMVKDEIPPICRDSANL